MYGRAGLIDFSGKIVLVTGGGVGIGRATAEAFGKAGAKLAVIEGKRQDRADGVRQALEDAGVEAMVVVGDVTDSATVAKLAEDIDARFGGLDVLVNNVGDFLMIAKRFGT